MIALYWETGGTPPIGGASTSVRSTSSKRIDYVEVES